MRRHLTWCVLLVGFVATSVLADPPAAMYIFPAGGQRGTEVKVRVGGMYLHESAPWEVLGPGVTASPRLAQTETIWFEGPVIPLPDSQQSEDYPKDYLGTIQIEPNATAAARAWRIWTAQGATPARTFVLGDLPEIVEEEIDGRPVAVPVVAPITINGRIFPREDVDVWSINAKPGESFTCTALGASLGSPLEVRLEVRDPNGLAIAESSAVPLPDCDASVRFVAPVAGNYSVRIHDLRFGGLQHYVYRLTITNGPYVDHLFPLGGRRGTTTEFHLAGQKVPDKPIPLQLPVEGSQTQAQFSLPSGNSNRVILDLDEFPEIVERLDRRGTEPAATPQAVPFVANGRIASPGETDVWPVSLKKGEVIQLETRAARLGTPIDTVMSIADAAGKELAQNDDLAGGISDSALAFTAPEEGVYLVRVTERDPDRGGPTFAYRLRVTSASRPDFRLFLTENAVALTRGGEVKLKVRVERTGGYAGEIIPEIIGNLEGVTVTAPPIAANVNELQISLKTDALAKVAAGRLEVRGTAMIGDQKVVRVAQFTLGLAGKPEVDSVLCAVAVPTPFKVKGVYEVKYAQRGSRFVRQFALDRGSYEGPLEVRLADKQTRHLQGVTGRAITVPAGATQFEYSVFLPPWMEIGRTSRTVVMAVGEVADPDGTKHKVSFTSLQQNEQIVALVDPGQLSLDLTRKTAMVRAGESVKIPVRVGRGTGVTGEAKVELVVPRHIRGVAAETITLPANSENGELQLRFSPDGGGPYNQPLLLRATVLKDGDVPFVAEAKIELVESGDVKR